jgi:simple sugar transport system permease protein
MQLFNIGGEGQLYAGAIVGAGAGIALGNHSGWVSVPAMIASGAVGGAALALVPAVLRAFFSTNEIITSLMLNYVGALVISYLIFDSQSYWRDTSSPTAKVFPQGKNLPDSASWPVSHARSLMLPFGFLVGIVLAFVIWLLYTRTRFGFEVQVIGDSPRAASYAGMRTRRKILAVMAISGALAGLGGLNYVLGYKHYYEEGFAGGAGFLGIAVALVGRNHPVGIVIAAMLFATLSQGGLAVNALVPKQMMDVLQAVVIVAMATAVPEVRRALATLRPAQA